MREPRTLAIGDIHGHYDRLEALLVQEGILGEVNDEGVRPRINDEVEVVLLGDLGHFGHAGSPTGDKMVWEVADDWADVILWGNHDRAVVDSNHVFSGYTKPDPEVLHIMRKLEHDGKLKFAHAVHNTLLTHAGLHAEWAHQKIPNGLKRDSPYDVADYINSREDIALTDAIGESRGGWSRFGGTLWRDVKENIYNNFTQVFGHTASREHVVRGGDKDNWWCIDIGGKGGFNSQEASCLAGFWLPEKKVVRVDRVGFESPE